MDKYEGIVGRNQLIEELEHKYIEKNAKTVTLIYAGYGQGKSFVINSLVKNLMKSEKDISIYQNQEDEFILYSHTPKAKELNSIDISLGIPAVSLGFGIGWDNRHSYYNKIKNMLSKHMIKNVLFCVEDISNVSDSIRAFVTFTIENIEKLEYEFKKKVFFLITDTENFYEKAIYKYNITKEIISLKNYSLEDIKLFLNQSNKICNATENNVQKIYELSNGNLHLAEFLYEEILVQDNDYLSTLNDVINKKIDLIRAKGEKNDLNGKDIENIIFSASLALKKFSAAFLTEIVNKDILDVSNGLEIAKKEALLDQDIKKHYSFLSTDIQEHIARKTIVDQEYWLASYYNYYAENEQDEYYFRAYYLLKYQGEMSSTAFSLLILAYSASLRMSDDLKSLKIIDLFNFYSNDNVNHIFFSIKNFYDSLSTNKSLDEVRESYKAAQNDFLELAIKAELTCEYFHYLYLNTKMDNPLYLNVLNQCKEYALHELVLNVSEIDSIISIDETVLRLKIIYDIAPCVLDQLNNYIDFQNLYQKSKELSQFNYNFRHLNFGQYIQNVFNRKAFLFVNQASCNVFYEEAKNFFGMNKIWDEYCITLICEAGTDIVIQQYEEALHCCEKVKNICEEQCIQLPLIEKLYNNEIIAEFLFAEQNANSITAATKAAKKALNKLKKCIKKSNNTTQFVIITNICSLALYCNDDTLYLKYKHKLEKLYECPDISNIEDEKIDDFYRYYFAWFELYRTIQCDNWENAQMYVSLMDGFIPAIFKKQEIFWEKKTEAIQYIIDNKQNISAYDFCHNLVKTKRSEQTLSKFFYRGLMLSDLQYTSYF
jgi:hypothetical protein